MLFMYVHTHPMEKCTATKMDENAKTFSKLQDEAKKAGIKIVGSYVAMHEHTMYLIFEASDLAPLEKCLIPLTTWGNARLIPVVSMEQTLAAVR